MASNIGQVFKVCSFGESHGSAVGVVVEGCPPQLALSVEEIQRELDRRRPGQNHLVTQRKERDRVEILSGIYEGKSLGSPLCLLIRNEDTKGGDYNLIKTLFRPSHGDYTYLSKYGIHFSEGGGRASARVTAGWVAAGAVAKKILQEQAGMEIIAYVKQIKHLIGTISLEKLSLKDVEASPVRCPDKKISEEMETLILETQKEGDSLGGIIECFVRDMPVGLGEPVFDKLEADLAKAMMSIPATKGFEIGEGFKSAEKKGSELNDVFYLDPEKGVQTRTNASGGVQAGISNGMPLFFRVAFKPTATIYKEQSTLTRDLKEMSFTGSGRHDACVLPRAVPIVEAMTAIVLCDHLLRQRVIAP